MKRKGQIIVGLALILIFILMALAAPLLAPNDPNATGLALKNAPPSSEYPLGCDQMGRCELSRLLYGARYSMGLTIPVLIVLAAFALFVGCYSSYKGGLVDTPIALSVCNSFNCSRGMDSIYVCYGKSAESRRGSHYEPICSNRFRGFWGACESVAWELDCLFYFSGNHSEMGRI